MFQGPGLGRGAKLGSGGGFEGVFSLGTGPLVVGVHSTGSLIRANFCECHWLSPYSAPLATSWDRSRKRRGGWEGPLTGCQSVSVQCPTPDIRACFSYFVIVRY